MTIEQLSNNVLRTRTRLGVSACTFWSFDVLDSCCLGSSLVLLGSLVSVYRGGPIERSLVMRKFPAPKARPREAPSVQLRPAPSQARPPSFLRVFFAATLAWFCLSGTLFGAITCNVKHEQSTSELCRKRQRSRVSERNPDRCLTPTPPYSAKTEEM